MKVAKYDGLGPDIYDAVVGAVTPKKAQATGAPYLRWEFVTSDGDISANSSAVITPGNKTGKWYSAITGLALVEDMDIEMQDCVGKPCRIVVELNPEGYPKVSSVTGPKAVHKANTTEAVNKAESQPVTPNLIPGDGGDLPF